MNSEAHVIEIERIVLAGCDPGDPAAMTALVATALRERLAAIDPWMGTELADGALAAQVARTVVRSAQGDPDAG